MVCSQNCKKVVEFAMIPNAYVLRVLSDGEFHSGEELGSLLGVSRAAVWKQLQQFEPFGLLIESVRGRGYRIPGGLDLLDHTVIVESLTGGWADRNFDFQVLDCVDSTNAYLMAHDVNTDIAACVAEYQAAGRGRRGRVWVSPYAASLYLSVRRRFESGVAALEGLSLAVGVVLVKMLRGFGYENVKLKWPNDLLVEGAKLGGVLIEISGDPSGAVDVVVGVGINVRVPSKYADSIDQQWTDLSSLSSGRTPLRNKLTAASLAAITDLLETFEGDGFEAYRGEWNAMDFCVGQKVEIRLGMEQKFGIARGVDTKGSLLLEHEGGLMTFSGGEISLRKST